MSLSPISRYNPIDLAYAAMQREQQQVATINHNVSLLGVPGSIAEVTEDFSLRSLQAAASATAFTMHITDPSHIAFSDIPPLPFQRIKDPHAKRFTMAGNNIIEREQVQYLDQATRRHTLLSSVYRGFMRLLYDTVLKG